VQVGSLAAQKGAARALASAECPHGRLHGRGRSVAPAHDRPRRIASRVDRKQLRPAKRPSGTTDGRRAQHEPCDNAKLRCTAAHAPKQLGVVVAAARTREPLDGAVGEDNLNLDDIVGAHAATAAQMPHTSQQYVPYTDGRPGTDGCGEARGLCRLAHGAEARTSSQRDRLCGSIARNTVQVRHLQEQRALVNAELTVSATTHRQRRAAAPELAALALRCTAHGEDHIVRIQRCQHQSRVIASAIVAAARRCDGFHVALSARHVHTSLELRERVRDELRDGCRRHYSGLFFCH
jgi:hypothetical protein